MTRRILTIAAILALAACRPVSHPPPEPTSSDGSAETTEIVADPDVEVAPDPSPVEEPRQADTAELLAPPSLPSLMRQAGYDRASEANLADFVHVPPGAEGEAGTFGEGQNAVRVALIAYPNPRYVRPHVTDVRERTRVLAEAREAVLFHHRWVVHIVAVDHERVEEAEERIRRVLGW